MEYRWQGALLVAGVAAIRTVMPEPAFAQADTSVGEDLAAAKAEIAAQKEQLARQAEQLARQEARLHALETRLTEMAAAHPPASTAEGASAQPAGRQLAGGQPRTGGLERIGEAPADYDRPLEVAVLGEQGSAITRKGQLTGEFQVDYARSDRNRALFRGIEVVESVLVGVFDINESRQDVVTASAALRYGFSNRFELGVKVPFVRRSDTSIIAPIQGSTPNDSAATIDNSARGSGVGDIELTARYQLTRPSRNKPFLVANLQGIIPTGRGPFDIRRDDLGRPTRAATGAGFVGIAPSITAIIPSDPLVLFGSVGYNFNLAKKVDTRIPPVKVEWVDPADSISFSGGVGIAFNNRTSLNFGYAHNWSFGTKTRARLIDPGPNDPGPVTRRSRDLQIGRFLFGVTHKINNRASLNWSVEVGATEDAPDVRTSIRIPFALFGGR